MSRERNGKYAIKLAITSRNKFRLSYLHASFFLLFFFLPSMLASESTCRVNFFAFLIHGEQDYVVSFDVTGTRRILTNFDVRCLSRKKEKLYEFANRTCDTERCIVSRFNIGTIDDQKYETSI